MYKYNMDSIKPICIQKPMPHGAYKIPMWYESEGAQRVFQAFMGLIVAWVFITLFLICFGG